MQILLVKLKRAVPLIVVVGVALVSVWGAVVKMAGVTHIGYDGWLLVWIMNKSAENIFGLFSGKWSTLFDANIFYSYKNVLAYSDMHMLSGIMGQLGVFLTQNPAGVYGFNVVVGQVLTLVVVYKWWTKLVGDRWSAAVGSLAFGLAQIRWEYIVHLQMWSMQYMLIATWLIIEGLTRGKGRYMFIGAGVLGLQMWESPLPIYFSIMIILMYVACNWKWIKLPLASVVLAVGIFGIIAAPVAKVYLDVGKEFQYQRSIREAAHNSLGVDELVAKWVSPGMYVLVVVAMILLKTRVGQDKKLIWLVMVLVVGMIMAMGPVVKWQGKTVKVIGTNYAIPLPYSAAYYSIPGFGALRTPSRWLWVSALAASGIIAIGLRGKKRLGMVAALVVVVITGRHLVNWETWPSENLYPKVYKWLGGQLGDVMIEMPMYNWATSQGREEYRMVYSLAHKKKLVNGYSGFTPPGVMDLIEQVNKDPLKKLKDVDYVVVHIDECKAMGMACANMDQLDGIIWKDEETVVVGR